MEKYELSDEDYAFIYSKVPRLCVDLFIKTEGGVLLTKRSIKPHFGKWHLPGGRVRMNERIKDAIKRLGKEELGLEVEGLKLEGFAEFDESDVNKNSVALIFSTKIISGKPILNEDASEYMFAKELPKDMVEQHRDFLNKNL